MAKPTILTVDDDPEVARAVERDLKSKFGEAYRVLRAESGADALDVLRRLQERGDPVALLVADQRMPEMTGVEFLERAMAMYPDAKRVLLTAYADTDAAIRAINRVRVHYYLMKPWDPPEANLYPYLTDILDDWSAAYRPPYEGIRVIGQRWAPDSHRVRDFLGRNQVPFQWLDVDLARDEARPILARLERGGERPVLPLVLFPEGGHLSNPSALTLAERVGMRTQAQRPYYDLAVVGAGPAGLAAAVYGASEGLHTVMIEREAPGGQAGASSNIENYLGFPAGLTGADLTRRGLTQALKFGAEILRPHDVTSVRCADAYRVLTLGDGAELSARAVIVATGVRWSRLDVPGAERLTGAGVYYGAAATEAMSCRGEEVFVVGAGNSAGQGAVHFAQYARRVTLLVRGDGLGATMSQYLVDQIDAMPNVAVRTRTRVTAVAGERHLESLTLAGPDGEETLPATSLFVFIGAAPHTAWLGDTVLRDERGFVLTGPDLLCDGSYPASWSLDRDPYLLEASVPGTFVAGDVRHQSVKRVASAVGEGSMAVSFVHQYLATT
jgi:thioredoxin reductase (NADPH)